MLDSIVALSRYAVPWDRIAVRYYTAQGTPYTRWIAMRLGDYKWVLDIAFFLYPTAADAKAGKKSGGTGFFVNIPSERWPETIQHTYAVTNYHVALGTVRSRPCPVIRINIKGGGTEVFDFDPAEWHFRAGGHDIAIIGPLPLSRDRHQVEALGPDWFLTPQLMNEMDINVAETVFMLGRFIDYDGIEVNQPSLRFGHISIMRAPILQPTPWHFDGPSHIVDLHSRTGYSGSPVFLYRTPGNELSSMVAFKHDLLLLGIHWGQFPERWELKDDESHKAASESPSLITTGKYVEGLSGMSCVAPATAILDLLGDSTMTARRKAREDAIAKKYPNLDNLPKAEVAEERDNNPNHRERFNRLLGAAVKPQKSSD